MWIDYDRSLMTSCNKVVEAFVDKWIEAVEASLESQLRMHIVGKEKTPKLNRTVVEQIAFGIGWRNALLKFMIPSRTSYFNKLSQHYDWQEIDRVQPWINRDPLADAIDFAQDNVAKGSDHMVLDEDLRYYCLNGGQSQMTYEQARDKGLTLIKGNFASHIAVGRLVDERINRISKMRELFAKQVHLLYGKGIEVMPTLKQRYYNIFAYEIAFKYYFAESKQA